MNGLCASAELGKWSTPLTMTTLLGSAIRSAARRTGLGARRMSTVAPVEEGAPFIDSGSLAIVGAVYVGAHALLRAPQVRSFPGLAEVPLSLRRCRPLGLSRWPGG